MPELMGSFSRRIYTGTLQSVSDDIAYRFFRLEATNRRVYSQEDTPTLRVGATVFQVVGDRFTHRRE
jgi:phosphatidylserine decarboxylase